MKAVVQIEIKIPKDYAKSKEKADFYVLATLAEISDRSLYEVMAKEISIAYSDGGFYEAN